ncbi:hypothetical protein [Longimicrobium sp.]|uniref:hypothetical protein n=1 Tax=Longimicrobium sp. TaxID=2029185 RepID=UPI002ED975E3
MLYVALSLLVLWAVFRGLWAAARAVGGSFGTRGTVLAGSARIKLLGLAISALLFTPLINRLARAVLNLLVALTDRLPRHLLAHWRTQVDVCDPAGARCVGDTLLVLAQATGGGIASAFRASGILSIGFGYVIFFLALWALATHALNAIFTRGKEGKDLDVRDLLVDKDFKVARQNFLFFLILFIGAYLSLASIAAIPDLRPEKGSVPTAFSSVTLTQNLVKQQLAIGEGSQNLDNPLALAERILYPALVPAATGATAENRNRPTGESARRSPGTLTRKGANVAADTGRNEAPRIASDDRAQDGAATQTTTTGAGPQNAQTETVVGEGRADQPATTAEPVAQRDSSTGAPAPVAQPDSATGAPAIPRINPRIPAQHKTALQAQLHELRQVWGDRTAELDSTVSTLNRESSEARLLAAAAYVDTDTTRRLREQRTYFHRLQRWFVEVQSDLRADYDDSRVDVLRLERRLRNWSMAASGYLTSDAPDPAQFQAVRRHGLRLSAEAAVGDERTPRLRDPLPERGEGLGPFQYVSGWLLKTDSMPLTLIVGMLGFGLLGAAASTFVREQTRRERRESAWIRRWQREYAKRPPSDSHKEAAADAAAKADAATPDRPSQPLVLNLPSVVIRGGSAAIVVFLGIMGGLSVLTQEAEPNPYALLFTCLVGAVFSENVWHWAEKRFGLNLGGEEPDEADGSGKKGLDAKRSGDTEEDGGQEGEGVEEGEGGESGEEGGDSGEGGGGEGESESDTRGGGGDPKP